MKKLVTLDEAINKRIAEIRAAEEAKAAAEAAAAEARLERQRKAAMMFHRWLSEQIGIDITPLRIKVAEDQNSNYPFCAYFDYKNGHMKFLAWFDLKNGEVKPNPDEIWMWRATNIHRNTYDDYKLSQFVDALISLTPQPLNL